MAKAPSAAAAEKRADRKVCFIVGPIGEARSPVRQLADWLMKGVIKPVLESEEFNYSVKRADHDTDPGSITSSVIADLVNADLVIADLTGFNPNAFYELGIRHALRKPAIHMIAEVVKLPFDNADQRTIFVNIADFDSVEEAKSRLRSAIQAIAREGYQVTNPVVQAAAVSALKESGDPKDRIIASLEDRLSRLEQEREAGRVARINPGKYIRDAADNIIDFDSLTLSNGAEITPAQRALLKLVASDENAQQKMSLFGAHFGKGGNPVINAEIAKAIRDQKRSDDSARND